MAYVSYPVSKNLPRLGARSVGALGTPPVSGAVNSGVFGALGTPPVSGAVRSGVLGAGPAMSDPFAAYTTGMTDAQATAFMTCVKLKNHAHIGVRPTATELNDCKKAALAPPKTSDPLEPYTKGMSDTQKAAFAACIGTKTDPTSIGACMLQVGKTQVSSGFLASMTPMTKWALVGGAVLVVGYVLLK